MTDWADEIAKVLCFTERQQHSYSEEWYLHGDIATALRKAKADGEKTGFHRGRDVGLSEAAKIVMQSGLVTPINSTDLAMQFFAAASNLDHPPTS